MITRPPENLVDGLSLSVLALRDAAWHLRNFLFGVPLAVLLAGIHFQAWPVGLIAGGLVYFVLHRIHAVVAESAGDLAERIRPLDAAELDALRQSAPKAADLLAAWQRSRPVLSIDRAAILDEFDR